MIPGPRFFLPTMVEVNNQAPPFFSEDVIVHASPFARDTYTNLEIPENTVRFIHEDFLTAVLRALALAGWSVYRTYVIPNITEVDRSVTPTVFSDILDTDLIEQQFTHDLDMLISPEDPFLHSGLPDALPAEAACLLVLAYEPFLDGVAESLTLPVPIPESGDPWFLYPVVDPTYIVLYGTSRPATSKDILRLLAVATSAFESRLVDLLVARLESGVPLMPGDSGLLWTLDPVHWPAETTEREGDPLSVMGEVAHELVSQIGSPLLSATDFLESQLYKRGRGKLAQLLRHLPETRQSAEKRRFFKAVRELDKDHLLKPRVFRGIKHTPWIETIWHLVTFGLLPMPDLGSQNEEYDVEEPLTEELTEDLKSVVLTLFGREVATLTLVRELYAFTGRERASADGPSTKLGIVDVTSWELAVDTDDSIPVLHIVAAPGVAIDTVGQDDPRWRMEIFRVQDPGLVPGAGTRIMPELLVSKFPVGTLFRGPDPEGVDREIPAVSVSPQPNGCHLTFPAVPNIAGQTRFVVYIEIDDIMSGDERFGFDVLELEAQNHDDSHYFAVSITRTPGVKVTAYSINDVEWEWQWWGLGGGFIPWWYNYGIFLYDLAFEDIEPPGTRLQIGPSSAEWAIHTQGLTGTPALQTDQGSVTASKLDHMWTSDKSEIQLFFTAMDISLGLIPFVGDAIDIEEFLLAIATGRDKWGRRVTTLDYILMGAGCAIPFVSSGFLKGMGREIAKNVDDVIGLSVYDDALQTLIRSGDPADAMELRKAIGQHAIDLANNVSRISGLAQIGGKLVAGLDVPLDAVTSAKADGFIIPQLQYKLMEYRHTVGPLGATVEQFIQGTKDEGAKLVLEAVLGPNWKTATRSAGWSPAVQWRRVFPSLGARVARQPRMDAATIKGILTASPTAFMTKIESLGVLPAEDVARLAPHVQRLLSSNGVIDEAIIDGFLPRARRFRPAGKNVDDLLGDLLIGMRIAETQLDGSKALIQRAQQVVPPEAARSFVGRAAGALNLNAMTLDNLMEIHGIGAIFADLTRRSGYEHGIRAEFNAVGLALAVTGRPADIFCQLKLSFWSRRLGKSLLGKGPDIVIYHLGKAELWQIKAMDTLNEAIHALEGQFIKDVMRLDGSNFMVDFPGRGLIPVLKTMRGLIDEAWLQRLGRAHENLPEYERAVEEGVRKMGDQNNWPNANVTLEYF